MILVDEGDNEGKGSSFYLVRRETQTPLILMTIKNETNTTMHVIQMLDRVVTIVLVVTL